MLPPSTQLDIFADSRDVMLRNDLAAALLRGDVEAARSVAAELAADFGGDAVLAPAALLTASLERQREVAPDATFDAITIVAKRRDLEQNLAPAARAVFGAEDADAWVASQWRRLAQHATAIAWQARDADALAHEHADAHAASLYVQARAWPEVEAAVLRIDSWHRIPLPLSWMALARWHTQSADGGWPLLAEALWLAPRQALALLSTLPDANLRRLAKRFDDDFGPERPHDWAWFPAWALIEQPLLANVLRPARATAEDDPAVAGYRLVQALLRLERQGSHRELIEHRSRLRALSQPLFTAYMRTR